MSGRISAATERAIALVAGGMIPYRAAKAAGISLGTMYRAAKRERLKREKQLAEEAANLSAPKPS